MKILEIRPIRRIASLMEGILPGLIPGAIQQGTALVAPDKPAIPSFDKRRDALPAAQVSAQRQQAQADLQARMRSVRVDYDPVTVAPAFISNLGLLSKPTDQEIQRIGDLGLAKDDPYRAIKAFLIENAILFGHGAEVLASAPISREFVTARNGMRTVVWQQQLDGIPVFEAVLKGSITARGELVNISSHLVKSGV